MLFKALSFSLLFLVFVSCTSAPHALTPADSLSESIRIPGESAVREKNITAEYFAIAVSYEEVKNYSKAIEYYKLAMKNEEQKNSAYYKIGWCYAMNKEWEKAREIYEAQLKIDSENTNLKASLAYITAMCGNLREAIVAYKELSSANPTSVDYLKNYIYVLMADGKYEIADEQFAILKETFPDDSDIADIQTKLADGLDL